MVIGTTSGNPDALLPAARRAVREVDPNILVMSAQTLSDHIRLHTYMNRIAAWLTASLGGLALLLTAVGFDYGVDRLFGFPADTQEIGIRMALGAPAHDGVFRRLREGLRLDLIGLALGAGPRLSDWGGDGRRAVRRRRGFDPIAFAGSVRLKVVVVSAWQLLPRPPPRHAPRPRGCAARGIGRSFMSAETKSADDNNPKHRFDRGG